MVVVVCVVVVVITGVVVLVVTVLDGEGTTEPVQVNVTVDVGAVGIGGQDTPPDTPLSATHCT